MIYKMPPIISSTPPTLVNVDGTYTYDIQFSGYVKHIQAGVKNSDGTTGYLPGWLTLTDTYGTGNILLSAILTGNASYSHFQNNPNSYKNIFVKLSEDGGETVEQVWDITVPIPAPTADFKLTIDTVDEGGDTVEIVKSHNEWVSVTFSSTGTSYTNVNYEWKIGDVEKSTNAAFSETFNNQGTYQISLTVTNVGDGLSITKTKVFNFKWKPKTPTLRSRLWTGLYGNHEVPLQGEVIYDVSGGEVGRRGVLGEDKLYGDNDQVFVTENSTSYCTITILDKLSFKITPKQDNVSGGETITLEVIVKDLDNLESPPTFIGIAVIAPPILQDVFKNMWPSAAVSLKGADGGFTLRNLDFTNIQDYLRQFSLHVKYKNNENAMGGKFKLKTGIADGLLSYYDYGADAGWKEFSGTAEVAWGTPLKFEDRAAAEDGGGAHGKIKDVQPIYGNLVFEIIDQYEQITEATLNISLDSLISYLAAYRMSFVGKNLTQSPSSGLPWAGYSWPNGIIYDFLSNWVNSSSSPASPPLGIKRKKYHAFIRILLESKSNGWGSYLKVKTVPIPTELLFLPFTTTKSNTILFNSGATIDITDLGDNSFYSPIMEVGEQITIKPRSGSNFTIKVTTAGGETANKVAILAEYEILGDPTITAVTRQSSQKWQTGDEVILNGEKIYLGGVGGNGAEENEEEGGGDIKKKAEPNYHRDRIKDRTWQKSFFPSGKNVSVANKYHQHQMSKRAIAALGTANSTCGNTVIKKHRVGNSKPRTENGVSAAARQPRALQQSSSIRNRSRPHRGRLISIGNGGILTPSARAVGSMDRLARLKAAAMGGTKTKGGNGPRCDQIKKC